MQNTLTPATTYPAIVGGVLSQLRAQQGLHQEHVAQAVGINQTTLSRIEKGQSSLTIEQLRLVAQKLGHSPSEILGFADQTEASMHIQGIAVTATRDNEAFNKTMVVIGAAALMAIVVMIIANTQKS